MGGGCHLPALKGVPRAPFCLQVSVCLPPWSLCFLHKVHEQLAWVFVCQLGGTSSGEPQDGFRPAFLPLFTGRRCHSPDQGHLHGGENRAALNDGLRCRFECKVPFVWWELPCNAEARNRRVQMHSFICKRYLMSRVFIASQDHAVEYHDMRATPCARSLHHADSYAEVRCAWSATLR